MFLNNSIICVDDDIFHIVIFIIFSSSYFYVRLSHDHAHSSVRV